MRIFLCPKCGAIRVIGRRKDVECFKCEIPMELDKKLDFLSYMDMSTEERESYAAGWLEKHETKRKGQK